MSGSTWSAPRFGAWPWAIVFGILRAGVWGFVAPKPDAPVWLGLSPVIWLVFAGGATLAAFLAWESRRIERGDGALIDPAMLDNLQLRTGSCPSSSCS